MKLDYYGWPPRRYAGEHNKLPISIEPLPKLSTDQEAKCYIPADGLQAAVNVALLLENHLSHRRTRHGENEVGRQRQVQLGLTNLFKFVAKSTSTGKDLLYN